VTLTLRSSAQTRSRYETLTFDLRDRLVAEGYHKPIIFMSALSAEEVPARVKGTGACDFLRKPFTDERLIECLDKALKSANARTLDAYDLV
jgi:FixJ family two-component response regulator